ncbi:hypothetical protein NtRootA1_28090 [Arthrobacter sp. NtRootA1]|nr:hypothetical protein NtRootA1_28090 [Arthrobacter sp. NtRootA1]
MLQYEFNNSLLTAATARVRPVRTSWATVSSKLGYQSGMEEAAGTPGNDAVVFPGSVASSWDGMCLLSFAVVVTLGGGTDKIDA